MESNSNFARFNEIIRILKDSHIVNGMTPEKLCETIEKLGPTFIKLGQIMSLRVDLLSNEYCDALSKLRSNVTPLSFEEVENVLKNNYENIEDIFLSIDPIPIGSASIAQVHRAVLKKNNKDVVIKIKRPGIDEILETDIRLFKKAVNLLHLNKIIKVMDLNEVLDQVYIVTKEETNFIIETNHLIEFDNKNRKSGYVRCPYVYENLCTTEVIVMDYVDGLRINDIEGLKRLKVDVNKLAELLCDNYINQALEDGFFHADPHPDNILVDKNKIVYIDLGIMGRLSEKNKGLLKKCIKAIVVNDHKEVSKILVNMSTKTDEVDYMVLENDVAAILEEFGDLDLDSISTTKFVSSMFNMLRKNHLVLDQDVTMLIRGIATIEPVIKELNSKISLLKVLSTSNPLILRELFNIDNIRDKSRKIMNNVDKMIDIPGELSSLLKSVNTGETKFKLELSDSTKQVDKIENLVHELIIGFIDGCLIISSVLITDEELRKIFIIFAIILSLWLLIKMIIDLIHRGY